MKKILIIITFVITLFINNGVNAKESELNIGKNLFSVEHNLTLVCADTNDIEDPFWGCIKREEIVKCGDGNIPAPVPPIIRTLVKLIKIAAPIVLIVMGMVDMLSAVIANDEKKIKDAQMKFPRRLLPAALIFLTVTIIQLLVGMLADSKAETDSIMKCIDCIISDASKCS